MKKRGLLLLITLSLALFTGGCKNEDTADKYIGEQITAMKEGNTEYLSLLLDKGIMDSNNLYVLQFPEELKEPYLTFLQKALSEIEFEVEEAQKNEDAFSVLVTYTPLDIGAATKDVTEQYLSEMSSFDLSAETEALLVECEAALQKSPVYKEETYTTINVEKKEDTFSVTEEEMVTLLSLALPNYMMPYNSICEPLNERDRLQSHLDASFKGDFEQFTKHTGKTLEEAAEWYEGDFFDLPEDMDSSYADRYTAAMKQLIGQCKYVVGIPRKTDGLYAYTIDITVTPNTSITSIISELENGTYYSEDEVVRTFIELLEKYAAAPTYGGETVVTIPLNPTFYAETNEEREQLMQTILNYGE